MAFDSINSMTPPRTALVTGSAGGIGAAIAALLIERGLDVVLVDRDQQVVETAERLGGRAIALDITDVDALDRAAETVASLDVLVNSAAIASAAIASAAIASAGIASAADPDRARLDTGFDRTLDVNVTGIVRVVSAFLPQLRRSTSGRILSIGSVQGFAAAGDSLAYATSKGAVHSLTRALSVDLAPDGILVNALAPGFVDTAMAKLPDGTSEYDTDWFRTVYIEHGRIPLRRPAQPAEIAAAAEFFVSEHNTYVTGVVLPIDGGLLATF
jgi:NAD(P)-dependent dehydrogenase (short-subunit alcohol dehydrogenase family)